MFKQGSMRNRPETVWCIGSSKLGAMVVLAITGLITMAAGVAAQAGTELPADEVFIEKSGIADALVLHKTVEYLPFTKTTVFFAKVLDKRTSAVVGVHLDVSGNVIDWDAVSNEELRAT